MSASRMSSSSIVEIRAIVANIRQHVSKGTTEKLLEDENFVFEMLKVRIVAISLQNMTFPNKNVNSPTHFLNWEFFKSLKSFTA